MRGAIAYRIVTSPLFVAALIVLIVNDHVLKAAYPGWVTGKASDLAGLVVFPLMILSALDLVAGLRHRQARYSLAAVTLATGVVFAAIQVHPGVAEAYREAYGFLQYPFRTLMGATNQVAVQHTADPTDLVALVALFVPWLVLSRVYRRPSAARAESVAVGRATRGSAPQSSLASGTSRRR